MLLILVLSSQTNVVRKSKTFILLCSICNVLGGSIILKITP